MLSLEGSISSCLIRYHFEISETYSSGFFEKVEVGVMLVLHRIYPSTKPRRSSGIMILQYSPSKMPCFWEYCSPLEFVLGGFLATASRKTSQTAFSLSAGWDL